MILALLNVSGSGQEEGTAPHLSASSTRRVGMPNTTLEAIRVANRHDSELCTLVSPVHYFLLCLRCLCILYLALNISAHCIFGCIHKYSTSVVLYCAWRVLSVLTARHAAGVCTLYLLYLLSLYLLDSLYLPYLLTIGTIQSCTLSPSNLRLRILRVSLVLPTKRTQ